MNLPVQSPACVCDHRSVMEEIAREQSLVTQLRAIVLPALQGDQRSELVAQMFQNILDCSSKGLQLLCQSDDASAHDKLVDDKKRVRRILDDCNKEDVKPHHNKYKRRRFCDDPVSLKTPVPHYDGHQWRKYGQKNINKAKYSRSYYRCTYKQEQDCKATKTVQQEDDNIIGTDHPVMYTVVYHGQHTCKGNSGGHPSTDDSETNTTTPSSSNSGSSPYDDHQTPVLDDSNLLNRSTDLLTKNNICEVLDMTSFATLDFGSWELDALLISPKF